MIRKDFFFKSIGLLNIFALKSQPSQLTDNSYTIIVINEIELLRKEVHSIKDPLIAFVLGYYQRGDGGGGYFYWDDKDSNSLDNGGTILTPNYSGFSGKGRWKRIIQNSFTNVKWFGAKGDGIQNDRPFIQNALIYLNKSGGGICHFPKGVYLLDTIHHPKNESHLISLYAFGNTTLSGDGVDITILKRISNQPNQSLILTNYNIDNGSDQNITIQDLTIDGNGANQTGSIDRQLGITLVRASNCYFKRVKVKNIYGTEKGGNGPHGTFGESFCFDAQLGTAIFYDSCICDVDDGSDSASGFSSDSGVTVVYTNCYVHGMTKGNGFTCFGSTNVTYNTCFSFSNYNSGFNLENSYNVIYNACQSGYINLNRTDVVGINSRFMSSNQTLANKTGFICAIYSRMVTYNSCYAVGNQNTGLQLSGVTTIRINAGKYTNSKFGISIFKTNNCKITGSPVLDENSVADLDTENGYVSNKKISNKPRLPQSNTNYLNPFPFDCMIYMDGKALGTIEIDNQSLSGLFSGNFILPQGSSIRISYTIPPIWEWFPLL